MKSKIRILSGIAEFVVKVGTAGTNAEGMHLMGGIVIQDPNSENWYYPSLPIDNTDSLKGWDVLDLHQLNQKSF